MADRPRPSSDKGSVCPLEPSVFVWSSAYYVHSSKHWEHGELQVTPSTLRFYNVPTTTTSVSTPEKQARSLLLLIKLDNIAELKKSSSSYVFKCIVVLMKDGSDHWLGSFPGRDGAYNALLHFWRERLLGNSSEKPSGSGTKVGQELLSVAQEAADTMKDAGETLRTQGEQLEYSRSVMLDLHNDLDVAGRLTNNLEGWFGHWGVTNPNLSIEPIELLDTTGVPVIHEFPVLYHEGGASQKLQQAHSLLTKVHLSPKRGPPIHELNGFLRLSREGATILDTDQKPVYHFKTREISAINVNSPWKLSLVKYCIGEADLVYKITSTQMMGILQVIHTLAHDKIQYESPVGEPVIPHFVTELGPVNITGNQLHDLDPSSNQPLTLSADVPHTSIPHTVQLHTDPEDISTEEVNQLTDLVGSMKSMALDIQVEQDKQMESIDTLTESVDRANSRLVENTQRINKLI